MFGLKIFQQLKDKAEYFATCKKENNLSFDHLCCS